MIWFFLSLFSAFSGAEDFTIHQVIELGLPDGEIYGSSDRLNKTAVTFSEDFIYLIDQSFNKALIFSHKGHFVSTFVKTGQGPDEIARIGYVIPSAKYVLINDELNPSQYLVYSSTGEFQKKITLPPGELIEGWVHSTILDDKYVVTPYFFRSSWKGRGRTVVRELLTGKVVADFGEEALETDMVIGPLELATDAKTLWIQVPYTRSFEIYDRKTFKLIGHRAYPYTSGDELFDVEHFNRMVKKGGNPFDLMVYQSEECALPKHFALAGKYFVTYEAMLTRPHTVSIYDRESRKPVARLIYRKKGRPDGYGVFLGTFKGKLAFYKEPQGEDDVTAGAITLLNIPGS